MGVSSNTLRIGNKVQDDAGFIFDVVSIHDDGTVYCDFDGNEGGVWEFDNNNPCKGIGLTEEILLKCGFEKIKNAEYPHSFIINKGMRNEVEIENLNAYKCFTFSHGKRFSCIRIDYLHQLQNLYFALTNQELNVKL